MVQPALVRGPRLEGRRVAHHGGEVVVVQEVDHLLGLLDADESQVGERDGPQFRALRFAHLLVCRRPAGADQEDVARLEGYVLFGCARLQRR